MTNIANLPDNFGAQITYTISKNGDFRDAVQFVDDNKAPIDITGIDFYAQVRKNAGGNDLLLDMSTKNGLIQVDLGLAQLTFAVPRSRPAVEPFYCTSNLPVGVATAVLDIIATDGITFKNLCQVSGPCPVAIVEGVTAISAK